MQKLTQYLSLLLKLLAFACVMDWTSLVDAKTALIIFIGASTAKDLVTKLGDFFDDGQLNQSFKTLAILATAGALAIGCARFTTKQTDISYDPETGKPSRTITTSAKATTFIEARSQLANFKASQTDKSQSATVGSLTQEASTTNAAAAAGAFIGELMKAGAAIATPAPK